MRFRKSIKIMKGVRVNFKSGLSLTGGVRGASVNVGSKGVFMNTGFPGTGLYDRKRIGGSSSSNSSNSSSKNSNTSISITVGIDDYGNYFINDQNGNIISDESLLRKIKRSEAYKNKILDLSKKFALEKNGETDAFVDIYKKSEEIISENEVKERLANLHPQVYVKTEYDGPIPNEIAIKADVESEAKKKITTLAFWKIKKLRNDFVDKQFPLQLKYENEKYEKAVSEFNEQQLVIQADKNNEYNKFFLDEKEYIDNFLSGEKQFIEDSIDSFFQSMTLPVNFEVSYEYDKNKSLLIVDLDLPEIEDLPSAKATTLSSGKVKVKEKSQKEIKEQYLICITGLAFFISSHLFNFSTNIKQILISGYTQRINKKTGTMNDDYVYSIILNREKVEKMNMENILPYIAFEEFTNKINYNKIFDLQTIEPMSLSDLET